MDLMDIQDLAFVDINELGVRSNWIDDESEVDYKQEAKNLFDKDNSSNQQEKLLSSDDISMSDDDEINYQIDPETGNYTRGFFFRPSLLT